MPTARLRALIVAYDFPPHAAIGTMRTLRLVRQLHDENWDVRVLTSARWTFVPGTPVDPLLEAQVPANVRVLRAPAVRAMDSTTRVLARLTWQRNNRAANISYPSVKATRLSRSRGRLWRARDFLDAALSVPDNDAGWICPAILRGLQDIVTSGKPDVIYSSAPPWSGHAVALALARLTGCPWVADFRDPWSRAPWREWRRPFRQRAAAALERRVIARAHKVLFVTRANLDEFASFYGPTAASRFQHVPNGCEPEEFLNVQPLPPRPEFVLLHAGTLYGARNPLPLLEAIARAISRRALNRHSFRLRLLGNTSLRVDLPAECRRLGIDGVVEFVPRVTRSESLREMVSASALLLVQPVTTVSVPGKAYEYLAAGRPVMAFAEEGETTELVKASGVGVAVRPDAGVEAIEAALLDIVKMASSAYHAPPARLYDGRAHAATTSALLAQLVYSPRQTTPTLAPAAQTPAAIRSGEQQR